jgi:alpha-glucuronidase
MKSPFNDKKQMIVVAGDDDNGVLYGVIDFKNKYIP